MSGGLAATVAQRAGRLIGTLALQASGELTGIMVSAAKPLDPAGSTLGDVEELDTCGNDDETRF